MFNNLFKSILSSELTINTFLLCTLVSLISGFVLSFSHIYKNRTTKSFAVTVALLPLIVQAVIMLVNGNLGTGIAVAGAFSLVRFRSVPGNAKEILSIFMAMAVGLATGVGHIGVALILTLLLTLANILYTSLGFGDNGNLARELKITVPESLNYTDAFETVFRDNLKEVNLKRIKTSNMGSLYQLTYSVTLKKADSERVLIDELRTRNGNLEISCNITPTVSEEL